MTETTAIGSDVLTVVRDTRLPGPPAEAWPFLTEGSRLSDWFADSASLSPGGDVRFEFGDGDFFVGQVTAWEEPRVLGLRWKFLGIGDESDIEYSLHPHGPETLVRVRDRGATSEEQAEGLREGWDDFLMRLQRRARTGERVRYRWTDTIAAGARLRGAGGGGRVAPLDARWWPACFPEASIALDIAGETVTARFEDPAWPGLQTRATLKVDVAGPDLLVHVSHGGWAELPEDRQVAERRRYAGHWTTALQRLEEEQEASRRAPHPP